MALPLQLIPGLFPRSQSLEFSLRNRLMSVFAVLAAVLFSAGPAWAAETESTASTDAERKALLEAANRAQVPINFEQIVTATSENVALVGTSIAGFEQIPATQFANGTNIAFVYLDLPASGIPAGYYRLRTTAARQDITVGNYPGTTEFISQDGKVVARLPSSIDTTSLQVPNPLPYPRTLVDATIEESDAKRLTLTLTIRVRCPNGSTVTIRVTVRI